MIKKPLLLFLALILPVSVFLFLHFFGKNKFDIPVYFEAPSADIPGDCQMEYKFPYLVQSANLEIHETTVVFFTKGLSEKVVNESIFQLTRLNEEFESLSPKLMLVNSGSDNPSIPASTLALDSSVYEKEWKCIFLAGSNRLVLVDSVNQIRGLYPEASRKEVDRLILELKILFGQYQ